MTEIKKWSDEMVDELYSLRQRGFCYRAIGVRLGGRSESSVRSAYRRYIENPLKREKRSVEDEILRESKLVAAAKDLINIVEGLPSVRWAYEGRRLKDTKEWCVFYCAMPS